MLSVDRRTIYEKSCRDRRAYSLPASDVPEVPVEELVPAGLRRAAPARLPEVGELDLLRHFTYLSTLDFGIESGSYPLGLSLIHISEPTRLGMISYAVF